MSGFNPNVPLPVCPPGTEPVQNKLRHFFSSTYYPLLTKDRSLACAALIDFLIENKIKMIASDFDLTMITVHSGGCVPNRELGAVLTKLSKDFDNFARSAVKKGIRISVVTYADDGMMDSSEGLCGKNLVLATLQKSQANFPVERVYPFFPRRYARPSRYEPLGLDSPMHDSKRYHLRRLCYDYKLNPWEVILIDDQESNCVFAAEEGFLSLRVKGSSGFSHENLSPA